MAQISLNWSQAGLDGLGPLDAAIGALPPGARVTFMVHGFRFDPSRPDRSPHTHIFGAQPRPQSWKAVSWPKHLRTLRDPEHLGIGFAWPALGRLDRVAARAFDAGAGLAEVMARIHARRSDLQVGLIAHSLGARVVLRALSLGPGTVGVRAILLSGAEYCETARAAIAPLADQSGAIFNIRSSENLPFDLAFRAMIPAPRGSARPLSWGMPDLARWIDLRTDCAATRADLRRLGYRIPPPQTRFCHWSSYLRPGLFPLYRQILAPDNAPFLNTLRGIARRCGEPEAAISPLRWASTPPI